MARIVEQAARGGGVATQVIESGLTTTGQTAWLRLAGPHLHHFACELEAVSSPVGTFLVEARPTDQTGQNPGEIKAIFSSATPADFPRVGRLVGDWEVRMRCSVYGSGTYTMRVKQGG